MSLEKEPKRSAEEQVPLASGVRIALVEVLQKLPDTALGIWLVASLIVSVVLVGYVFSLLPATYIGVFVVLILLYFNFILLHLVERVRLIRGSESERARWRQALHSERSRWTNELKSERSQRIAAFARRDSTGVLPRRCLMIIAVPRSGSTWLMDALRTHPAVYFEPSAIVFQRLELRGNRYPKGLSDGPDGTIDLEVGLGRGAMVPEFSSPETRALLPRPDVSQPYAIEKIHPEFFDYDVDAFLARVDRLAQEDQMALDFVYLVRDPQAAFTSFLSYQKRDPTWYPTLTETALAHFMDNTYASLHEMATHREGLVVDYAELMNDMRTSVVGVYKRLWPGSDGRVLSAIATAAADSTARGRRVGAHKSPFLGEEPGPIRGGKQDYSPFFERYQREIAHCYESYDALIELARGDRVRP